MTWLVTNWCGQAQCILDFENINEVHEWLEKHGQSIHPELEVKVSFDNNKWTLYVDEIEIYSATEIDHITTI